MLALLLAEPILALHRAGMRLVFHDFGTGCSALACLRRYLFDTLKIDRRFVRDLLTRGDARAIVNLVSRPMPAAAVAAFLGRWRATPPGPWADEAAEGMITSVPAD